MSVFYLVLFAISMLYLFVLILRFKQASSVYYILLAVCVMLITFGYWQLSVSQTLEQALLASKISYLGASFVGYFMVCSIAKICKTKIPVAARIACVGWGFAIACLAMTIGHFDIYYKSATLLSANGFSYLVKDYGPTHFLFVVGIIAELCYGFLIVAFSFKKGKTVSYISSIGSLAVMASVTIIYFIKVSVYPLLPLAYDVGFAILLLLLTRISLHDAVSVFGESLAQGKDYGFVNFDFKGRFLDGDERAREWFAELNELSLDRTVKDYSTDFLKQVKSWIDGEQSESRCFVCQDKIIEAKKNVFSTKTGKKVLCVYLQDDTKHQKYMQLIERYNADLQRDVQLKTQKIQQIQNDIIISMASIVENRDSNTGGHIRRSSEVVSVFVRHLLETNSVAELDEHLADCIIRSAPLHDFGKIAISDAILNKPGKYTAEEYEEMKKHPVLGTSIVARILQSSEDVTLKNVAVNVAHYHHEKWDGSGYPDGKKGLEIPFEARVMALADVFDALVSKRAYKEPFGFEKSFAIIEESSGSHFDPFLCKLFLECKQGLMQVYSDGENA
ncbi:MAG: HD domain-containing phosphohydrolase [Candidatus Fimimonas sp.]